MDEYLKIILGQSLLVVCCIFYLIWWGISYRPKTTVNRVGKLNGILLLITAACGIVGLVMTIYGSNDIPKVVENVNGLSLVIMGIIVYIILMLVTKIFFHRIVTTELLLIVGWAVLELSVLNSLYCAGRMQVTLIAVMLVIIAAAFIISMILYVQYYRMEEMKAFYAAMVPLATEAASMTILIVCMIA